MRAEQLCVNTNCYHWSPLERALAGIAESGVWRVELSGAVDMCLHGAPEHIGPGAADKLLRLFERYGLTAVSFSGHQDLTTEAGMEKVTARLHLAADMNIPIFNTGLLPPVLVPGVEDIFCENAVKLADLAAELGVLMCIETEGFIMGTGEECAALMKRLNHPNIRINYDPANLIVFRGVKPTAADIAMVAPYLAHMHIKDKSSMELDKWDFPIIGEGIIDWDEIFGELDRVGFSGPASVELEWEVAPESPEIVDEGVRRSVQFLQKYFKGS